MTEEWRRMGSRDQSFFQTRGWRDLVTAAFEAKHHLRLGEVKLPLRQMCPIRGNGAMQRLSGMVGRLLKPMEWPLETVFLNILHVKGGLFTAEQCRALP